MSEYVVDRENVWPYGSQREEIVRCRDCKHMETRGMRCYCAAHAGGYPEVSHDDFCSFGERRDA